MDEARAPCDKGGNSDKSGGRSEGRAASSTRAPNRASFLEERRDAFCAKVGTPELRRSSIAVRCTRIHARGSSFVAKKKRKK